MRNLLQVRIFAPHGLSNLHRENENVNCEYYYKTKISAPRYSKIALARLTSLGDWFWTLNPPFKPIFIWVSKIFLDYIGFAALRTVIWPKNFALRSQPIRCKNKTIHDLVARVFPRFRQFGCYHSDFPLPPKRYFLFIWLAVEITLVLVLPQSIKYSKTYRMRN